MEQKNKGRARVRIAVFVVLAIHGIGLLALLMQGCKKEPEPLAASETETNTTPAFVEPTNAVPAGSTNLTTTTALPSNPPPVVDTMPPAIPQQVTPTATATDYKVAQGDTFTSIARKFHVTVRAITDANPGVDPTKLKLDQVLHIPAPTAPTTTSGTATSTAPSTTNGSQVYTVKSGDTLTSIAAKHAVTVKALRAANNLTTDRIKVGQKLTIPAKASAPTPPTSSVPTSTDSTAPTGGVPTGTTPSGQ